MIGVANLSSGKLVLLYTPTSMPWRAVFCAFASIKVLVFEKNLYKCMNQKTLNISQLFESLFDYKTYLPLCMCVRVTECM